MYLKKLVLVGSTGDYLLVLGVSHSVPLVKNKTKNALPSLEATCSQNQIFVLEIISGFNIYQLK